MWTGKDSKAWYVLQTKPQKEGLVCSQLQRMPEEFQVFFPKIRLCQGVRPLFPSYLFVQMMMDEGLSHRIIKNTRGVLRMIGSRTDGPVPVADEVIATIQERIGPDGLIDQGSVYRMGQ